MIYFKDLRIKVHEEDWGAVVRTTNGQVIINSKLLDFYKKFVEVKYQSEKDLPKELKKLVKLKIILMIDERVASKNLER